MINQSAPDYGNVTNLRTYEMLQFNSRNYASYITAV